MNSAEALAATFTTSDMVMKSYLSDLEDKDLLSRPGPECNHIAWQLGHLIAAENDLLESICPGKGISLPEGFAEQHSKEKAPCDDGDKFLTKQQYLELFDQTEQAVRGALDSITPEELDQPSPEHFRKMFPTVGHVFVLIATHRLMHAGQWVPIRRMLGKPFVI